MSLEAKSAVEIGKQVWGKLELDLTQRRLDANLLSKLPSRFDGKLSLNAKSAVEIDEQIEGKLSLIWRKSAVKIAEQIWRKVALDELRRKIYCQKMPSRFEAKLSLIWRKDA